MKPSFGTSLTSSPRITPALAPFGQYYLTVEKFVKIKAGPVLPDNLVVLF